MKFKQFFIAPIKGYQYISKMLPANCRYYPTCSEYAKWQFEFNLPHKALAASALRILRCNQLFPGGIDYPVVHFHPTSMTKSLDVNGFYGKIKVIYWLVPKDESQSLYYVIKDFNDISKHDHTEHTP